MNKLSWILILAILAVLIAVFTCTRQWKKILIIYLNYSDNYINKLFSKLDQKIQTIEVKLIQFDTHPIVKMYFVLHYWLEW